MMRRLIPAATLALAATLAPTSAHADVIRTLHVVGAYTISIACWNPGAVFRTTPGGSKTCSTGHIWVRVPAGKDLFSTGPGKARRLYRATGWHDCPCDGLDVYLLPVGGTS